MSTYKDISLERIRQACKEADDRYKKKTRECTAFINGKDYIYQILDFKNGSDIISIRDVSSLQQEFRLNRYFFCVNDDWTKMENLTLKELTKKINL